MYHIKQLVNKKSKKKQKEIPRTSVDLVALRLSCTGIRSQGFNHYSLTLFQLSYRGLIYHLMAFVIMVSTVSAHNLNWSMPVRAFGLVSDPQASAINIHIGTSCWNMRRSLFHGRYHICSPATDISDHATPSPPAFHLTFTTYTETNNIGHLYGDSPRYEQFAFKRSFIEGLWPLESVVWNV